MPADATRLRVALLPYADLDTLALLTVAAFVWPAFWARAIVRAALR